MSRQAARAVIDAGLNIAGTISLRRFNRPLTPRSAKNYLKRLSWRCSRSQLPDYPFVMDYGSHKELACQGLVPGVTDRQLQNALAECKKLAAPFCLATHYWELNQHPQMRKIMYKLFEPEDKELSFVTCETLFNNQANQKTTD